MTVAALYVDPNGVYAGLDDVEVWDEARDARGYFGPHRVIAHPPCASWCRLAPLNAALYGKRIGDDGGAFGHALWAVRSFGGVLEHPAYSIAWSTYGLPRPRRYSWQRTLLGEGWVTEVSQGAYGHPARKRTWLYFVGDDPAPLDWGEPESATLVSDLGPGQTRRRGADWIRGVQYAQASATPAAFRDALVSLVSSFSLERLVL